MINYDKIIEDCFNKISIDNKLGGNIPNKEQTLVTGHARKYFKEATLLSINESIKQAIPYILEQVADNCDLGTFDFPEDYIKAKKSILNLQSQLEKELL